MIENPCDTKSDTIIISWILFQTDKDFRGNCVIYGHFKLFFDIYFVFVLGDQTLVIDGALKDRN